jgi:hypothetical protein
VLGIIAKNNAFFSNIKDTSFLILVGKSDKNNPKNI